MPKTGPAQEAFFRASPPSRVPRGRLQPKRGRLQPYAILRERRVQWQQETAPLPETGRKRKLQLTAEELPEAELSCKRARSLSNDPQIPCVYLDLPLVYQLLTNQTFADSKQSSIVTHLIGKGVVPLAEDTACQGTPLAGCIAYFQRNWEALTQDPWILQTVSGYRLDLCETLYQSQPPRQLHFSEAEKSCLQEEVQNMLKKQAISETRERQRGSGFHSQLFLIPKKDGGQRPIINLKRLNAFVKTEHFKMEGIHMLKDLLKPNDWMVKVDMKDAYFMVPIATEDRKFLRFEWEGKTYQFNCLPFGLSSAPWVFTKTIRPVVAQLRELGVRLIIYIDDILLMAESETILRDHTLGLVFLLENLGFVINSKKSQFTPTRELEFLGFTINSQTMEMKLPGEKLKKIRAEARQLQMANDPTALMLSRFLGKLNAATSAIPSAPLFYRNLQRSLRESLARGGQNYSTRVHLNPEDQEELQWWEEHLSR